MRILRGLSSKFLPCGCLAGVYETYDGDVVTILDAKSPTCMNKAHHDGNLIPDDVVSPMSASASDAFRRRSTQD
jgi:hypothetical protein